MRIKLIKIKSIIITLGTTLYLLLCAIIILRHFQTFDETLESTTEENKKIKVKEFEKEDINHNIKIPTIEKHDQPGNEMLGENGVPVLLTELNLTETEKVKYKIGYKNYSFNEYLSNKISIFRRLPDIRDKECLTYKYAKDLPQTSVIMCFYNEAWSVLLRSIHSVINRSPKHLLKEIILVDDFSDLDHLKRPLENYISQLGIVKIFRTSKREGLIRARIIGSEFATGETLTFLDSHIECSEGWLEPLLDPIAQSWSNVSIPVINTINKDSFEYMSVRLEYLSVGGFSWDFVFTWHKIPKQDKIGRKLTDPIRSPTMPGGLFSINKKYFEYLGKYDPGLQIWGGENLELSFKVWMCGGHMTIVPCSNIGHVFREKFPYEVNSSGFVIENNLVRVVEVWLDEYKEIYYARRNKSYAINHDLSKQKALRKKLKCKSFKWYLDNIYPNQFIPWKCVYYGEIRNNVVPICIDAPNHYTLLSTYTCHGLFGNQLWMTTETEIRRDDMCIEFDNNELKTSRCSENLGNQHWKYMESKQIKQMAYNLCMELSATDHKLMMTPCSESPYQKWEFQINTRRID